MRPPFCLRKPGQPACCQQASQHILEYQRQRQYRNGQKGELEQNKKSLIKSKRIHLIVRKDLGFAC